MNGKLLAVKILYKYTEHEISLMFQHFTFWHYFDNKSVFDLVDRYEQYDRVFQLVIAVTSIERFRLI